MYFDCFNCSPHFIRFRFTVQRTFERLLRRSADREHREPPIAKEKVSGRRRQSITLCIDFCRSPLSPEFTAGRMAHFQFRIASALDVAEAGNCDNARLDCFLDEHRLAFGTEKHLVCFILGGWTNLDLRLHFRIGRIENRTSAGRAPRDRELSFQLRPTFPRRCDTQIATPWIRSSASTGMSGYFFLLVLQDFRT